MKSSVIIASIFALSAAVSTARAEDPQARTPHFEDNIHFGGALGYSNASGNGVERALTRGAFSFAFNADYRFWNLLDVGLFYQASGSGFVLVLYDEYYSMSQYGVELRVHPTTWFHAGALVGSAKTTFAATTMIFLPLYYNSARSLALTGQLGFELPLNERDDSALTLDFQATNVAESTLTGQYQVYSVLFGFKMSAK